MKEILVENGLVIKSWCSAPEEGALEQARNLARLPFAFRQICLMPDAHQGYGMPIGGVMAADGVIIPNAVGVDIGCGMCAVKTSLTELPVDLLKKILGEIRKRIPLGMSHHREKQAAALLPECGSIDMPVILSEYERARTQVGTLGGGNHFIEIQKGDDKHIWIMVHSGSRNLGKQVADYYNKKAIAMNERHFSHDFKKWQLAFFPMDNPEGQRYLNEMQYCVAFALANRRLIMDRITAIFMETVCTVNFEPMLNIAHNYARIENHFGRTVIVHRKGATSALDGETGIIPGSQGTPSYIVRGKGNPESFASCSHGAGRKMGRKEAERTLTLSEEKKRLDEKGIIHSIRGTGDLDEAAGAYKDIDLVMTEQADLVDILVRLEPRGVVKG